MEHAQLVLSDHLNPALKRAELHRDPPPAPALGEFGQVCAGLKLRDYISEQGPGRPRRAPTVAAMAGSYESRRARPSGSTIDVRLPDDGMKGEFEAVGYHRARPRTRTGTTVRASEKL